MAGRWSKVLLSTRHKPFTRIAIVDPYFAQSSADLIDVASSDHGPFLCQLRIPQSLIDTLSTPEIKQWVPTKNVLHTLRVPRKTFCFGKVADTLRAYTHIASPIAESGMVSIWSMDKYFAEWTHINDARLWPTSPLTQYRTLSWKDRIVQYIEGLGGNARDMNPESVDWEAFTSFVLESPRAHVHPNYPYSFFGVLDPDSIGFHVYALVSDDAVIEGLAVQSHDLDQASLGHNTPGDTYIVE